MNNKILKKVCVVGLGYIGLPTAAVMASRGLDVLGVDINPEIINIINDGKIHIVEPELDILVQSVVYAGKLRATTVVEESDAFIIAVPTPITDTHQPDMSFVEMATISIADVLKKGDLVVLESTSPVGATEKLEKLLSERRPDLKFPWQNNVDPDVNIAYCPERVLPGNVVHELVANDRVVGGLTSACSRRAQKLYKTFVMGECIISDARTAEMTKLTENAFRDVNIAFANELSMICEDVGVDVWRLISLANRHPRVNILQPGPGVGGHCIAIDPWFIVHSAPSTAKLIKKAREVNDFKPEWVINKIQNAIDKQSKINKTVTVACLGLAFKPNIDDLRESPALEIATRLAKRSDINLYVVEPNIKVLPEVLQTQKNVLFTDLVSALAIADVVVILVDHNEFTSVDMEIISKKVVVDTRGLTMMKYD